MNNSNNGNLSFDSDVGGPMRKSNSNISLASSAYIGGWVVLDILGKVFVLILNFFYYWGIKCVCK